MRQQQTAQFIFVLHLDAAYTSAVDVVKLHAKTSIKDTSFLFRIPRLGKAPKPQPPSVSQGFLHGFVFCRQRQDNSLRRGGEQLSVVVLSEFPFSSPLTPLSQVAGPLYFSMGAAALKQVYQEVTTSWPPPLPGLLLQLPVGFTTLTCRLPPYSSLPYPSCQTTFDPPGPSSRTSVSRSSTNHSSLQDLSTLPRGGSPSSFHAHHQGRSKIATVQAQPGPPSLGRLSVPAGSQPQAPSSQALSSSTNADAGELEAQEGSRENSARDSWGMFSWLGRDKAGGGVDEGHKEVAKEESKHSGWLSGGWFGGEDGAKQEPGQGHNDARDGEEDDKERSQDNAMDVHAPGVPGFPLDAEPDVKPQVGAALLSQGSWPVPSAACEAGDGNLLGAAAPEHQEDVTPEKKHSGSAAVVEEQDASKAGLDLHNGGLPGVSLQGSGEVEGGLGSISRSFFGSGLFSSVGSLGSAEYPPAQRPSSKSPSGQLPPLEPPPQPSSALSSGSSHGSLAAESPRQPYTQQQQQQQQHLAAVFKQQQQQQQQLLPAASSSSLPPSLPLSSATSLQSSSPSQHHGHGPSAQGNNVPVVVRRLSVGLQDPSSHASSPPGPFQEADVFGPFAAQLDKLWHLWEMVLLGKPLMVFGPSPTDCSWTVAALLSLIAPIPFAYDFRPYYTIHDSAFALLAKGVLPGDLPHLHIQPLHSPTSAPNSPSPAEDVKASHSGGMGSSSPAGQQGSVDVPHEAEKEGQEGVDFGGGPQGVPCLFGVTNLFFVKALTHWPSILAINGRNSSNIWAASGKDRAGGPANSSSISNAVKAIRARSQGSQALLSGHMEALWSQYRPITRPDHKLLARLLQPKPGDIKSKVARIAFVNNGAIHRHFHDLTTGLLQPLQRYIELGPDGWLPVWDPEAFLQHLKATQAASVPAVVSERWVEFINLFFTQEQLLREAQSAATTEIAPQNAEESVARLRSELVNLLLGINQRDLQLICISAPQRKALLLEISHDLSPDQRKAIQELCAELD
ncbi:hypothetical protein DUNSADRAFT_15047 [Dunaliella salina]|uniref:UDENN domain-containing protein n=1 Tax=Dunaliella salina TaxID=3046 RepID=A0ABQ7G649_DUNSA|nr:hypothetical protein DUNSADRAFT_15047 [Dunaliella salina]|eukprot:KAF5830086.1 hypothetical protein DUNSADRAFT_15047 [Dunaliella salina]